MGGRMGRGWFGFHSGTVFFFNLNQEIVIFDMESVSTGGSNDKKIFKEISFISGEIGIFGTMFYTIFENTSPGQI